MDRYRAFRIHNEEGSHRAGIELLPEAGPAAGEVQIRTHYSSINYKDALAGTGKGKILRAFPLTGGVDCSGVIVASRAPGLHEGDEVLVTGYGLGVSHDGGYAEMVTVPAAWVIPRPTGLSLFEAMLLGTAGFTAALAVHRMQVNGQSPELGPVVVTGASGGVGTVAVNLLHDRGYEVVAVSGKSEARGLLQALGATRILQRGELVLGERPLEKAIWGGAVDSVGGEVLAGLTRSVAPGGNIASIGLAGGVALNTTVMPFILRGISLLGIDSVECRHDLRQRLWTELGGEHRPSGLRRIHARTVSLEGLAAGFEDLLAGRITGRILVDTRLGASAAANPPA